MDIQTFHAILDNSRGHALNSRQREAVEHGDGPLWLIAGPGSGKTEVLVTRTLKLLVVDGVQAKSIFITTFTKKAARNIEDRMAVCMAALEAGDAALAKVDLSDLRVGTLHPRRPAAAMTGGAAHQRRRGRRAELRDAPTLGLQSARRSRLAEPPRAYPVGVALPPCRSNFLSSPALQFSGGTKVFPSKTVLFPSTRTPPAGICGAPSTRK